MSELRNITSVELKNTPSQTENVLVEDSGVAKRVPINKIGGTGLPTGGTAGQVLKKTASGVEWSDASSGGSTEILTVTGELEDTEEDGIINNVSHTYAQIKEAFDSGKLIVFKDGGSIYPLTDLIYDQSKSSDCEAIFSAADKYDIVCIYISAVVSLNHWTIESLNPVPNCDASDANKVLMVKEEAYNPGTYDYEWYSINQVPEYSDSDVNKVLGVKYDYGEGTYLDWVEAGGSGAEKFYVEFSDGDDESKVVSNKTAKEIYDANAAGKIVIGKYFNRLFNINECFSISMMSVGYNLEFFYIDQNYSMHIKMNMGSENATEFDFYESDEAKFVCYFAEEVVEGETIITCKNIDGEVITSEQIITAYADNKIVEGIYDDNIYSLSACDDLISEEPIVEFSNSKKGIIIFGEDGWSFDKNYVIPYPVSSGRYLCSNVESDSVEWADIPKELPATLGTAGQVLKVNSGATGVEWGNASGGVEKFVINLIDEDDDFVYLDKTAKEIYDANTAGKVVEIEGAECVLSECNKISYTSGGTAYDIGFSILKIYADNLISIEGIRAKECVATNKKFNYYVADSYTVPKFLSSEAGKVLTVNEDGDGVEWKAAGGGDDKMDKINPTGTGSFSMNRKSGTTIGDYSVAEGSYSEASGDFSHAEGEWTTASKRSSHAEGCQTKADGNFSHAEGYYTTAKAQQHVSGIYNYSLNGTGYESGTRAINMNYISGEMNYTSSTSWNDDNGWYLIYFSGTKNSKVEHIYLEKNIDYTLSNNNKTLSLTQSALDKASSLSSISRIVKQLNPRNPQQYLHIVGNGLEDDNSNAYALSNAGVGRYAGDVYVNCEKDSTGGKKLATEEYVDAAAGGSDLFLVKTVYAGSSQYRADKTASEIYEAAKSGKKVVMQEQSDSEYIFFELVKADKDNSDNYYIRFSNLKNVKTNDVSKIRYEFRFIEKKSGSTVLYEKEYTSAPNYPSLAGEAGKVLKVREDEEGFEWGNAGGSSLPTYPSSDGTYFLKCVIVDGTPTLSWDTPPLYNGGVS